MFQVEDEYLRDLGFDNLPDKEKAEKIEEIQGCVIEKVMLKIVPLVPNLEELFDEAKQDYKNEILEFREL